jgi:hypothetical protein
VGGSDSLALHRRSRRYGVPEEMIEACAAARASGDWRLACAAGEVDVRLEPRRLPPGVEDMLAGFAPDLVRWHLPRARGGYTTLATGIDYVLAPDGPVDPDTTVLVLRSPVSVLGSQRLTLRTARWADLDTVRRNARDDAQLIRLAPYHWDARRAAGLRFAVGGSEQRVPMFTTGGEPIARGSLGTGGDRPALAERLVLAPGSDESWIAAGLTLNGWFEDDRWRPGRFRAVAVTIDPLRLAVEARRVSAQYRQASWALWYDHDRAVRIDVEDDTVRTTAVTSHHPREPVPIRALPRLHPGLLRFSADLELVWYGLLTPADLHPLVRAALFPAATAPARPAPATTPAIRVRCGGQWHEVHHRGGRLDLPSHADTEIRRERAMRAFGGTAAGCHAVAQAWTEPGGWLPRRLRAERADLWQRMTHGGTRVALDLLDHGMDPHLRDSRGRTLMHRLLAFDHVLLLPRLLDAGARIDAADREGHTPLATAIALGGGVDLVRALVEAGADPRGPSYNVEYMSILEYIAFQEKISRQERTPEALAVIAYLRTVA